ncbi:hypothetical protein PsorP6_004107 [Peronosclerospora sorghi]|uniref:Uncharacterized protein n=1 Tax=Peronosclerospora sorghi TaxID=230839 RepID=A0ACC0VPE7_9STRA|nr:hypothetical protein PsorP6_004107 [Peronosclerospora sorghi]
MKVVERDAQYNPEVFGDKEKHNRDTVAELCSQIMRAVQLLVRSSPGNSGSSDSQRNQLEKYEDCSDSVQATAYGALGMLVNRIAVLSPMHGEEFLRWMLLKWPQRNVQLELFYVKFTAELLSQLMQLGLVLPADAVRRVFTRIQACIQSMHFLVAQEACNMCRKFQLISVYLSRDHVVREKIASVLHENTTSHWNEPVRSPTSVLACS